MAWLFPPGRLHVLVIVALLAPLVSGCIQNDTPIHIAAGPGPFVDPMAYADGHDHGDHAQHRLAWNMTELGYTPLVPDLSVAWGELDIKTFGAREMAVVAFAWPTAGFATVDVTDPAEPVLLDYHDTGYGYGADVKWLDSGDFAVLAVQTHSTRDLPAPLIDPLAATVENGLVVFHITEAGEIHDIGSSTPGPTAGIHMVYTHVINGQEYVFAAYNGIGVVVYRFEFHDPPIGARLVPINTGIVWDPPTVSPPSTGFIGVHDMTVVHDETLDKPLLYVAAGYSGLWVFDISQPEDPLWPDRPLGTWEDPDNDWYMHTVQATTIDGRRLVVVVPEVFSEIEIEVVAPLWVLDATDLTAMEVVATWRNPGDHGAEQLRFSVHNFQLVGDKIALAHYHGGVWLLDLLTPGDAVLLQSAGYLLPANAPEWEKSGIYHGVYHMSDGPTVWDTVVHHGVVWATDVNSGLYAVQTPAWTPGDATATSIG